MPISIPDVKTLESLVIAKCESFVSMGIWPPEEKLKFRQWLKNFSETEKEHALYLLNSFNYYSLDMALAMLRSSIVALSSSLPLQNSLSSHKSNWNQFLADSIFLPVIGEDESITDSGNILAGHLRRDLGIPEYNILTVRKLYDPITGSQLKKYKNIIFFDDFIGSGQQFISMWQQEYEKDGKIFCNVKDQCIGFGLKPYYCCITATEYGLDRVSNQVTDVHISCSNIISSKSSPLDKDSTVWPEHLKKSGPQFIMDASIKAGIDVKNIKGYHNLALALAFSFTIPDATLPLFYWNNNGWSALMERT